MTTPQGAWRSLIVAALVGAAAGFGQAPYDLPVVLFAAFAVGFWLAGRQQTIRSAALLGWAFGTGYFLHSLHWIVSPFLVDVPRHGWMAPFALVFMAAGLALFWGAAFAGARDFHGPHRRRPWLMLQQGRDCPLWVRMGSIWHCSSVPRLPPAYSAQALRVTQVCLAQVPPLHCC